MRNVIDVLMERGLVDSMTSEEIKKAFETPAKVYCGFDPTADSLHLGNLVAIMGLAWFQRYGHTPVAIVGGATGMIGDPSGKSVERKFLDESTLETNLQGIKKNLETILESKEGIPTSVILNNIDWYRDVSFIEFLREIGPLFRVGTMLGKDSVRSRMQSEEGMSFTEFSYQVLQGYDFLHLHKHHQVILQLGGSDQWGNITAGTELIRKVTGKQAFGLTFPLLTKSDGQKFGKSEKGAIWLSPEKLSCYEFYQYLVRVEDADVIKLMQMLTFMEIDEIRHYEKQMQEANYVPRSAQKRLAEEITRLVHGEKGLETAIKVTEGINPGSKTILDAATLESFSHDMPSLEVSRTEIIEKELIDLLVLVFDISKTEAKRRIRGGGIYLNNEKIEEENFILTKDSLIEDRLILVSAGKKNRVLVRVT